MPRRITRRPNHHDHSAGKKTNGLIASFAAIETTILRRKSVASENQLGIFKCQPTVGRGTVPLGLVKG